MTKRQAELLMAAVIVARSTAYILSKFIMADIGPFTLMAIRFILAFLILMVLFRKRMSELNKDTFIDGFWLGGLFFAVMTAELFGLKFTASSTTAFLENTAVVFVPIFEAFLIRRLPHRRIIFCGLLTLTGVGFLTLSSDLFTIGIGECLCILAAILYAWAIILTDRLSRKSDPLLIGILQIGVMGFMSLPFAFIFETPHLPSSTIEWLAIIGLVLICSCFGFTFQPVTQQHLSSEESGMMCALNPLAAGVLGYVFMGETFGIGGLIGAALVLLGIILVNKSNEQKI